MFLLFILRMVSSYLVHHGYCATAEAFARSTDQTVLEELASIKNRQSKDPWCMANTCFQIIGLVTLTFRNLIFSWKFFFKCINLKLCLWNWLLLTFLKVTLKNSQDCSSILDVERWNCGEIFVKMFATFSLKMFSWAFRK